MKKKIITAMLLIALTAGMNACGSENTTTTETTNSANSTNSPTTANIQENSTIGDNNFMDYASFDNFKEPNEGDEIIVMTIKDYGVVKIRLFPDLVPKAVENFVTHAKNGYYDGLTYHRIVSEFMIQGGDPMGLGIGGESIWGGKFDSGMTDRLHHFTGALAYANSGSTATSGSQFYIVVNKPLTQTEINQYVQAGYSFDDETIAKYKEVGGAPFLDGGIFGGQYAYTVFGQVYEGQNIIETISKVETTPNSSNEKSSPVTPVIIESIKVETYKK